MLYNIQSETIVNQIHIVSLTN